MKKTKILIVEDEIILAKDIQYCLEMHGYSVAGFVSSGEKAIQKTSEESPDLVLMDIRLKGDMDGIEAARQIKSRFNIPVVYLTAHADNATLKRAKITEPYGYILKPFEDRDLHIGIEIALYKHQMEEKLIQSEKLKSLGTITAGISHEFNNILSVISGTIQLLQIKNKYSEELMDSFSNIMTSVRYGASITNRMLEFAKVDDTEAVSTSIDLVALLNDAIEFTKPRWETQAQARGIKYDIGKENIKDLPELMCIPSEIRSVFINIINNALDAMPDGGGISFSTWSKNDKVFIRISDTGKGITNEVQKSMFDPFFTTRRPEGTGLGLSIAYSIIKRHGGEIDIESKVGCGSTFTLLLPTSIKTVRSTATQESTLEAVGKVLHILVVDDEKQTCDILAEFLSRSGYKVKTAYSGTDAIELIKSESFDLVLCDHVMPDVTGCAVAWFIDGLEKRPRIGIITGWGEINKCISGEGVEVDFVVRKPFEFSELAKHITKLSGPDSN